MRPGLPDIHFGRYWDPCLKSKRAQYCRLIGYLVFTLAPLDHAGLFFVWKTDRKKIRMIVDGRRANARLLDPPGVDLLSAEGLSKFEVVPDIGDVEGPAAELHVGLSDVRDCLHRIGSSA